MCDKNEGMCRGEGKTPVPTTCPEGHFRVKPSFELSWKVNVTMNANAWSASSRVQKRFPALVSVVCVGPVMLFFIAPSTG